MINKNVNNKNYYFVTKQLFKMQMWYYNKVRYTYKQGFL
jgi:hypothetical protein